MSATLSTAVSIVLVLSAPRPGAECGSDLACTTRANLEAAKHASPEDRAQHLLTAARSRLALFRGTGEEKQLCLARRHAVQAARLPHEHLGDRPNATRHEIEAEIERLKIRCGAPARSGKDGRGQGSEPPLASEVAASRSQEHDDGALVITDSVTPPAADSTEPLLDVASTAHRPVGRPTPPVQAEGRAPVRVDTPSLLPAPPGRRLLITGGVLLGSAALAAGTAVFAFQRVDAERAQAAALAADAEAQGFTDPQIDQSAREAGNSALRWHRVMVATAIGGALLGATAVALLGAGARARRLVPGNIALHPTPAGLLLKARF